MGILYTVAGAKFSVFLLRLLRRCQEQGLPNGLYAGLKYVYWIMYEQLGMIMGLMIHECL